MILASLIKASVKRKTGWIRGIGQEAALKRGNVQQLKVSTCLGWQENCVTSNAAETFKDIYHVLGATLGNHEGFAHSWQRDAERHFCSSRSLTSQQFLMGEKTPSFCSIFSPFSPGNIFFGWNIFILRIKYSNIKANWHKLSQSLKSLSLSAVQMPWLDHFALTNIMRCFTKGL